MWDRIRAAENALAASPRLRSALFAAARGAPIPERERRRLERLGLIEDDGSLTEDGMELLLRIGSTTLPRIPQRVG